MGRVVMGYLPAVMACALFVGTPSLTHAEAPGKKEDGATQEQLEHVRDIARTCRAEAEAAVTYFEEESKKRGKPAIFYFLGRPGAELRVTKQDFFDNAMASCYLQKLMEDPVMEGQAVVTDGTPIT